MCGIAGGLGDLRGVDTAAMLTALAHRGPDDEGEWSAELGDAGRLWFGHRRLAIQDLSPAGHQPMHGHDGRRSIVFNGEIYNFKSLREALDAEGERFTSGSDTEVILAAFARWGVDAITRFRGMFAFALWDHETRTLTLARDRLGEKPLYYTRVGGRFLFASEVRALLASEAVPREFDDEGLDAWLTFGGCVDPYTLVDGVRALGAGEVMTVTRDGQSVKRYWSLAELPSSRVLDRAEAARGVRERLETSLRRCMVADVPVALLLSGGIDSSTNVALLASQGWKDLRTFSVTFGGVDAKHSEAPYAEMVAKRFGTQHQQFCVGLDEAKSLVPKAVASFDLPSQDGVNTWLVCEAIRRAGIKVAVSGQGSDELFLGYPTRRHFPWFFAAQRFMPRALRALVDRVGSRVPLAHDSAWEKAVEGAFGPGGVRAAYLAEHSVYSGRAIDRLRGSSRPHPSRFVDDMGGGHPLDRLSRLEVTHYLKNTLLRDGDAMSMSHAIEVRAPFVDSDLVEYVLSVDASAKVERARNKPLLLDAAGDDLPRAVWDRPKQGFGLPYDRWLREGLDLGHPVGPEIGLSPEAVRDVRQRFNAGQYYTRYWTLVVLAAWARRERMGTARLRGSP